MKRIPILTLLLCMLAIGTYAATLSGTVTDVTTGNPVSGQKVYVYDSLSFWSDSTTTNSSGGYSFTVPTAVPSGDLIMAYTAGCGGFRSWFTGFYAGTNMTANFTTCSSSPFILHGYITLGGVPNSGGAKLYLIRKTYDSISAAHILTAIDSMVTGTGGYYTKTFSSVPAGTLLLKAALLPSNPSYSSYLPTYYNGSASWSSATALGTSNFSSVMTNINMIGGTNPGGPGFIGGSVLMGANKTAGVGDPLPSRIIILTNSANQPVAYTYSDASGHFEFRNIAIGSYKLYGDAWGKNNPTLNVTLSNSQQSVNNVVFEENSTEFAGRIGGVGTGIPAQLATLKVYPNPATAYVQIDGLSTVNGDKTITLRGVTGAVISSQTVNTASLRIATGELPAGMYILHVATEAGSASYRFVK